MRKIKVILSDVDGVLTDGGMYYSKEGDIMKKFHARDGMGINMLRRNGISTIIITKEKSKFVKIWSRKMNIKKLYDGMVQKENIVELICKKWKIVPENLAYIGDDVNDIQIMNKVGFSVAPKDAVMEVKKIADYICKVNGGSGVFREVTDLILNYQFGDKKILY